MSEFEVTFLGTSASVPTVSRNVSGTLIKHNGKRFLVDCGEGTQRQMMQYGGLKAPDAIFLTHYHPDHDLGLPGLFATLNMAEHEDEIVVHGPPGLWGVQKMCAAAGGLPSFVKFKEYGTGGFDVIYDGLTVSSYTTDHGVKDRVSGYNSSFGYVFKEPDRPGRFDVDKALELGIEPGPTYSQLMRGEPVHIYGARYNETPITPDQVIGPPRPGRRLVLTGDTAPCETTVRAASNADVLVHEATFSQANAARARKVKHTTGSQAGTIAAKANVDRLVLTHFSPRDSASGIADEARKHFDGKVVAAKDGMTIKLPLKD